MKTKPLVVITGASSGIGAAFARRFSAEGHPLLLLARRREPMEALALPDTLCRSADVTDREAVTAAIREAEARYGKTDLLINCAGIMLLGRPDTQAYDEWSRMIDVNVKGILTGTQAVLPDMIARRGGTVINISSVAGRKTYDSHGVYCGTKFAVHAITENFRHETAGSNVRFIVLAPGVVETPLVTHTTDQAIKDGYNAFKETMGGGMQPETIADCAWFAYAMPQSVCVREVVIAPTRQPE